MRYKRKQSKTEKKQKVYCMPKSIECAYRKYEKVNTHKNKTELQNTRILEFTVVCWTNEMLLKFIVGNFFHVGGVSQVSI